MKRILSELEDMPWFPSFLRGYMTDYLQFLFSNFNLYAPVTTYLHDLLIQTRQKQLVDLCSGSGGPLLQIRKDYFSKYGSIPSIILTDKYPHAAITNHFAPGLFYNPEPVDAQNIPVTMKGVRTMFSSMHHFNKSELKSVLKDAVTKKQPVAFFDSGDKNAAFIIGIIILHPILLILLTPFIRPFRFKRLIFTYLIPLVIIGAIWDGIVSILHIHDEEDLRKVIDDKELSGFKWQVLQLNNRLGMKINGIIGMSED